MQQPEDTGPEGQQFQFLIGDWDVEGVRFRDDGTELTRYGGTWHASYLNDGRMVMDVFRIMGPHGKEVSSIVTLRTYCPATARWELAGLATQQPAWNAQWHGHWQDGEMVLDATGSGADGATTRNRIRFFDIGEHGFRWESHLSRDGERWVKSAALTARRQPRVASTASTATARNTTHE